MRAVYAQRKGEGFSLYFLMRAHADPAIRVMDIANREQKANPPIPGSGRFLVSAHTRMEEVEFGLAIFLSDG